MLRPNRPAKPPLIRADECRYKCCHTRKIKDLLLENCPVCRGKLAKAKQRRNGDRKPAAKAVGVFRYPAHTRIVKDFDGVHWFGMVARHDGKSFMGAPLAKITSEEAAKLGLTNGIKLEQALQEVYEANKNARPLSPKTGAG